MLKWKECPSPFVIFAFSAVAREVFFFFFFSSPFTKAFFHPNRSTCFLTQYTYLVSFTMRVVVLKWHPVLDFITIVMIAEAVLCCAVVSRGIIFNPQ